MRTISVGYHSHCIMAKAMLNDELVFYIQEVKNIVGTGDAPITPQHYRSYIE
jgi:hypothetical protein